MGFRCLERNYPKIHQNPHLGESSPKSIQIPGSVIICSEYMGQRLGHSPNPARSLRLLISHKADVHSRNAEGRRPIDAPTRVDQSGPLLLWNKRRSLEFDEDMKCSTWRYHWWDQNSGSLRYGFRIFSFHRIAVLGFVLVWDCIHVHPALCYGMLLQHNQHWFAPWLFRWSSRSWGGAQLLWWPGAAADSKPWWGCWWILWDCAPFDHFFDIRDTRFLDQRLPEWPLLLKLTS